MGESPIWFLDRDGKHLGELITPYSRHHKLLDWTGDGISELVVAHNRALYDVQGKRLATFLIPDELLPPLDNVELSVLKGDMNGDNIPDVLLITPSYMFVYTNFSGKVLEEEINLGTGMNVTLY